MNIRKASQSKRGGALIVVLFAVIALSGLSAALVSTGLFRFGAAKKTHEVERAFQAAMSGLDLALFEMNEATDLTSDEIGAATGTILGGDYAVTITPAFVGPGEYTLRSVGTFGLVRQGVEVVVHADKDFGFGIFARDSLTLGGDFMVDSYDSTLGAYADQVIGDHAREGGDIASNWNISVGSPVWGDATPGPEYQVLGNPGEVSGSTAPALFPITIPEVVYDPVGTSIGEYTGSAALNGGTYRYDSIKMTDDHTLTIDGDVTLYVDEDIKMTGESQIVVNPGASLTIHHGTGDISLGGQGIVNQTADPDSLWIRSATVDGDVKYTGGSDFYGVIFAPESEFTIVGNSSFFGAVVCAEAKLNGTGSLHYDEALEAPDDLTRMFRLKAAYKVAP